MAGTVTETEPTEQGAMAGPADTTDVDALLAEADALAEHAAAAAAQEQESEGEPSTQAEAVSAESASEPDQQSGASDQIAKPVSGLSSTLDDLDNLLEELGEKPQVVEAEPATEVAANPDEADGGSPAEAEPAPAAASTNPYADEIAKMEQEWAAAAKGGGDSRSSPATTQAESKPDGASGQDDATDEPAHSFSTRILHGLAAPAAGLLAIMDIPFARFSPWIKGLLGYAGLATLVVATMLWFVGPSLIHLPILAAAAPSATGEGESSEEGSASSKKASSSGSHSSAKGAKASGEGSHSSAKEAKPSSGGSHSSGKEAKKSAGSHSSSSKESKGSGEGKHAPAKKSH